MDPNISGNQSVNLVVSHFVLEHIAPDILDRLTGEFSRILTHDGMMLRFIDNFDHYEAFDKSISHLDFLRFQDWAWQLCCIHPQSFTKRMRHSDYVALFERH